LSTNPIFVAPPESFACAVVDESRESGSEPFWRGPPPYAPPKGSLPVIYQDDHLLIIDKPAGLLTVAGMTEELADCVASRAMQHFPGAMIVHRLDMSTSGVLALALDAKSHRNLSMQFMKRYTEKTYVAEVWGSPPSDSGSVDLPLGPDTERRPRQRVDHAEGRPSLTHWQLLDRRDHVSRLELRPITGRRHQLRVHMNELGCPIIGDEMYGTAESFAAAPRLMLHAATLTLRHPANGVPVTFKAPPPF